MITAFFHRLTVRNWGFPWHIVLSYQGVFVFAALMFFVAGWLGWHPAIYLYVVVPGIATLALGYAYEVRQQKKEWSVHNREDARREFLEDMAGNITGVILAAISFYIVYQIIAEAL